MADQQFRGIYGITPTPFNPDESLDLKGVDAILHFTIDAGAHGIVAPVMASEYNVLTDDERKIIFERSVKISNGRIPVVAGVTGISNPHSIALAKVAQDAGVDAVIAMPPHSRPTNRSEAVRFFEQLDQAMDVPVFIQNHNAGFGLDAGTLIEVMSGSTHIKWLKEETTWGSHVTTEVLEKAGDACKGIMGGASGRFLPSEFDRGMCGNMPASHFSDVIGAIWNKFDSGDIDGGRADHQRFLPMINFENIYGVAAFKEVLVRRGVIASATIRSPGRVEMDRQDHEELTKLLDGIDDLMTWKG
ncbi:MAG: dihydrodipicolinate synthase family protein [Chloroflexi bacterium]|nr:dihydrodipicolinate synthase family protein [Chloroflexota bacterium]